MKKEKGSLTLEAVISFTVFISFMFMLLTIVKLSMTIIALDSVVSETAKKTAAAAYPIGIFNDIVDENDESITAYEESTGFASDVTEIGTEGIMSYMFSETGFDKKEAQSGAYLGILGKVLNFGADELLNAVYNSAQNVLTTKSHDIIASSIKSALEEFGANINYDNLTLEVCKLPLPKKTYEEGCSSEGYTNMGLTKDDFDKDDVVIGLTYDYEMVLPFLPTINIKLKSMAIEKAWVTGGTNEPVSDEEGIKIDDLLYGKHYYIGVGGTGKCYHKKTCPTLYRGKKAVSVKDIKNGTYKLSPCKRCKPKKYL